MQNYLVIDIGGTDIKFATIDEKGTILTKDKVHTPQNKDDFLTAIDTIVKKHPDRQGIAICAPGKIADTTIHFGGALPFLDGIDFAAIYRADRVAVINDGKAAVLAEHWLGALKDSQNCAAIILGTGVGGGIILNNTLLNGAHFQAGELSFMCLDTKAEDFGGYAGSSLSAVQMIIHINNAVGNPDEKDGFKAFDALKAGNQQAKAIFAAYCHRLACLIMNIQSVADLDAFAIGGGISAQPLVLSGLKQAYEDIYANNPLIKLTFTKPKLVQAKFQADANLYGALYHLLILSK